MREIKVGDYTLLWEKSYGDTSEYRESDPITKFYYGQTSKTYRKYIFGPKVTITVPRFIFSIYGHIDDPNSTNEQLRNRVMSKYNHWVGLQERAEKLAKGELL